MNLSSKERMKKMMESLGNKKRDIHDDGDQDNISPKLPPADIEDDGSFERDLKKGLERDKELENMPPEGYEEEEAPVDGLTPYERGQKYKDRGGHEGDEASINEDDKLGGKGLFSRNKEITIKINLGGQKKNA